jgi:hypothetical protein
MTEFRDPFPELSQVVDIGGDRYFMGPQQPIELGFKSRQDFLNSFGNDRQTEYLIRKYMFISLKDKGKMKFDPPEEKLELVALLKKRAKQLERSKEFTSSLLKNTIIQRSFLNIQALIQQIERGDEGKGFKFPSMPNISLPCTKAKKYIREIPQDRLFQLVLEIAWYLLHPDKVPKKVQCDWASTIKQLDTLRLGDIMAQIRDASTSTNVEAFNYFKKINLESVAKKNTLHNALDEAILMATQVKGENATENVKDRLKLLLNILEMKKYLSGDLKENADMLKIIDNNAAKKIANSMIVNPMSGGASVLNNPLGIAMLPMYDYFKAVFDPIYSFVESNIHTFLSKNTANHIMIPHLTSLLHVCNNINPVEVAIGGANTYGIYKLTNVDAELVNFINNMLKSTEAYVDKFQEDKDKNIFNQQLFELPKVRLSSLLNKFINSNTYKDPDTIPYIQILSLGGNMSLMAKDAFMNPKKPEMTEEMFNQVNEFFNPDSLYILCTTSDNRSENIPMNLYNIDYDTVDMTSTGLKIDNIPDNYFNKNKDLSLHLENLVNITPYVVYNDAELALSIFIAFKELMPK